MTINKTNLNYFLTKDNNSQNKKYEYSVISEENPSTIYSANDAKHDFGDILSSHKSLKRINLMQNNFTDGALFTNALLHRRLPLESLDLSFNPIGMNDISDIRWASTLGYMSPFDINLGNQLLCNECVFGEEQLRMNGEYVSEPLVIKDEYILELFPVSQSMEIRNQMIREREEEKQMEIEEEMQFPSSAIIEFEVDVRTNKMCKSMVKQKRKQMCNEFIFVSQTFDKDLYLGGKNNVDVQSNVLNVNHGEQQRIGGDFYCSKNEQEFERKLLWRI